MPIVEVGIHRAFQNASCVHKDFHILVSAYAINIVVLDCPVNHSHRPNTPIIHLAPNSKPNISPTNSPSRKSNSPLRIHGPRRWGAFGYPWGSRGFPSYVPATARSVPATVGSRPRTRLTAFLVPAVPRHGAYSRTASPGKTPLSLY